MDARTSHTAHTIDPSHTSYISYNEYLNDPSNKYVQHVRCIDCRVTKPLVGRTICNMCRDKREKEKLKNDPRHCSI